MVLVLTEINDVLGQILEGRHYHIIMFMQSVLICNMLCVTSLTKIFHSSRNTFV